jgi:hypothetical protein
VAEGRLLPCVTLGTLYIITLHNVALMAGDMSHPVNEMQCNEKQRLLWPQLKLATDNHETAVIGRDARKCPHMAEVERWS